MAKCEHVNFWFLFNLRVHREGGGRGTAEFESLCSLDIM